MTLSQETITRAADIAAGLLNGLSRAAPRPLLIVGEEERSRRLILEGIALNLGIDVTPIGGLVAAELVTSDNRADVANTCARLLPKDAPAWLLDRVEVLFSPAVTTRGLDVLIRLAKLKPTCASWPGRHSAGRLRYARQDHPEHLDEDARRAVILDLSTIRDRP